MTPADTFWRTVEDAFLPAMEKGNAEAAGDAYLQMAEAFRAHRNAIDEVVRLARQNNAQLELAAAERERTILMDIAIFTGLVFRSLSRA